MTAEPSDSAGACPVAQSATCTNSENVILALREGIKASRELADALILRYAVTGRPARWQMRLIKAYWAVRGGTSERQLALRWLPSRYRLMVASADDPAGWTDWTRYIDGNRIPIFTCREGERRRFAFLQTHPDCIARLERRRG